MPALGQISGNLGELRAKHLLRRVTFGADKATINAFQGYNINTALNQLFSFAMPLDPVSPTVAGWPNPASKPVDTEEDFVQEELFRTWWMGKMYEDNSALEKLTFFLHTVITTKKGVVGNSRFMYYQNKMLRQYIINDFTNANPNFGNYKQFIRKMITENSMLVFLDGRINEKGLPNENFGRELLELFTLGKGPTIGAGNYTNYTENDIKEAAKLLTGWTTDNFFNAGSTTNTASIDTATGLPTGVLKLSTPSNIAYAHDNTSKSVLGVNISPNPALLSPTGEPTAASASDEIDKLVEAIFAKTDGAGVSVAAKYFCRRLYRHFVHWNVTADIETSIITPLAQQMQAQGFRISGVIRTLFSSEHFFYFGASGDNAKIDDKYGSMIKSPIDITLGTMRYFKTLLNPQIPTHDSNPAVFYTKMGNIIREIMLMGLDLMEPYDVAGYEPFHQEPNFTRNWITTNNLANRYNFIRKLFTQSNGWGFYVDVYAWAKNTALSGISTATATASTSVAGKPYAKNLARYIAAEFLPLYTEVSELTEKRMNYFAAYHIKNIADVNGDANTFPEWVDAWNTPRIDTATGALKDLLSAVIQSPEYQLF